MASKSASSVTRSKAWPLWVFVIQEDQEQGVAPLSVCHSGSAAARVLATLVWVWSPDPQGQRAGLAPPQWYGLVVTWQALGVEVWGGPSPVVPQALLPLGGQGS